jgi:hypothetical protein
LERDRSQRWPAPRIWACLLWLLGKVIPPPPVMLLIYFGLWRCINSQGLLWAGNLIKNLLI